MAAHHLDCRAPPGARCGVAHQGDHGVKRVDQQALARSRDRRKETTRHHMVLRTRARGVCHTTFHTNLRSQPWPSRLEERGGGRVAAAVVALPEARGRLRITPLADAMPIPAKGGALL